MTGKKRFITVWGVSIVLLTVSGRSAGALPPRPSGPVADFANVIDNDTELRINSIARKLWVEAGFGLLLVTVDSIGNAPPDSFLTVLCRQWRVWTKNNSEGAVVLLSFAPPRVFVEAGAGSVSYLTPAVRSMLSKKIRCTSKRSALVSERSLATIATLAALVSEVKKLPPGEFAFVQLPSKKHVPVPMNFICRYPGVIFLCTGVLLAFVTGALLRFFPRKRNWYRAREPFGNVLAGEGFGGRLSSEKRR